MADTRFSFTAEFLIGGTIMARRAAEIEAKPIDDVGEDERFEHLSHVVLSRDGALRGPSGSYAP
jgi:hypothetical protein